MMKDLGKRIEDLSPENRALLAQRLREKRAEIAGELALRRRKDQNNYALSFAQERLWFLDQFEPQSPLYNVPAVLRLTGPLDVSALRQSLNEIIRRHEVLRATFPSDKGQPQQVIAPELILQLFVTDLRALPASEKDRTVLQLATEEAQKPFDLAKEPLVRACLLQTDTDTHVLLLTMHHIVFDGWSTGIMLRELSLLYDALRKGGRSPLSELAIQYADYAAWQRNWLTGERMERQLNYWKKSLSGIPAFLEIPADRFHPSIQTYRGARYRFTIPDPLWDKLSAISRSEEVTPFMTLLAGFAVMLSRYAGQSDICLGTPIANRTRPEIEGLIGFFVNTLVMRVDVSAEPTFRVLLKRVREVALGAYANQDLPFEKLVEASGQRRELSHSPLFQVMFDFQEAPEGHLDFGGLKADLLEFETGTAKFDLMLTLQEGHNGLKGCLEYKTDLFYAATVERMAGDFVHLLEKLVAAPNQPVTSLCLLGEPEQKRILQSWNDTCADIDLHACVHQRFEEQVLRTPEALAVVLPRSDDGPGSQFSYHQLNRRANQLARCLIEQGIGLEARVGICLERSPEIAVAVLGILKAGAAYVPLDPAYPRERLRFMLEDARVASLVTQSQLLENLPTQNIRALCLDSHQDLIERQSGENLANRAAPVNLAYVIYTSGSTGQPKGVMIPHRSVLNLAAALQTVIYDAHPRQHLRISLNAPLPFDASVQQLAMLLYGHSLYIIPQDVRLDGRSLLDFIRDHRVEVLDCVPSQLKLLIEAGLFKEADGRPLAILPGGEAIDESTWQMLCDAQAMEFYNMYGPTECTVDSTICRVKTAGEIATIGRPALNGRFYVLDGCLQPVPVGVPGELHIGGAGVGRGYINQPGLTAERFIPDFFSNEPGARLYKTGDLVRYLPSGNIQFLGRFDDQVKIRGFRIELGEIEACLKAHPAVHSALVAVKEDSVGGQRLVGYVVPESEQTVSTRNLREFLAERLPDYMVPSAFMSLEHFPLTPSGKINRRSLPDPEINCNDSATEYAPPQTSVEKTLTAIWTEVLKINEVGIFDNFFELGGHSLLATQVISRVRESFRIELPVRDFFQMPTIADLAERIEILSWAIEPTRQSQTPDRIGREEGEL
jgi:amino acid adenylation domain-containing protein